MLKPAVAGGQRLLVVAHGNSLRALVKHIDGISDDAIVKLNIPTGIPLVYELDADLKPIKSYYLGDQEAIAAATVAAVHMLESPLVVVFTKSGFTARIVSSHRPTVPILALTDEPRVCRQLSLVWGVVPRLVPTARGYDHMVAMALREALDMSLVTKGDRVLVTAGVPFDVPGTTNLLKVETV